jgi:TonB family protein
VAVFSELQPENRSQWRVSAALSLALHLTALLILTHHAKPIFVMPSDVALGTPGSTGSVVYLAPSGVEKTAAPEEKPRLIPHIKTPPPTAVARHSTPDKESDNPSTDANFDETARAGSLYGTRVPGAPLTGHEVIPALPQVFPDPKVSPADLPPGVQGDVVVEVTIDEQGNVIELKLIRGIGYGVEERVLATLRQWRFRPASKDGVTIASQHIVTFHYPS